MTLSRKKAFRGGPETIRVVIVFFLGILVSYQKEMLEKKKKEREKSEIERQMTQDH